MGPITRTNVVPIFSLAPVADSTPPKIAPSTSRKNILPTMEVTPDRKSVKKLCTKPASVKRETKAAARTAVMRGPTPFMLRKINAAIATTIAMVDMVTLAITHSPNKKFSQNMQHQLVYFGKIDAVRRNILHF